MLSDWSISYMVYKNGLQTFSKYDIGLVVSYKIPNKNLPKSVTKNAFHATVHYCSCGYTNSANSSSVTLLSCTLAHGKNILVMNLQLDHTNYFQALLSGTLILNIAKKYTTRFDSSVYRQTVNFSTVQNMLGLLPVSWCVWWCAVLYSSGDEIGSFSNLCASHFSFAARFHFLIGPECTLFVINHIRPGNIPNFHCEQSHVDAIGTEKILLQMILTNYLSIRGQKRI